MSGTGWNDARREREFWARVTKEPEDGCWLWTGSKTTAGYGFIERAGKRRGAHRHAYEMLVGPIPEGLQLDHLCRVRNCVNPYHLEPVTCAENLRRSPIAHGQNIDTCCKGLHPWPESRIPHISVVGGWQCGPCLKAWRAKWERERAIQPATCPDCGKGMKRGSLIDHRRIIHGRGKSDD